MPQLKVKMDLGAFTRPYTEDTSTRLLRLIDKHKIDVRIEICSQNRPSETTNETVMSTVTEGTLADKTTSLESDSLELEIQQLRRSKGVAPAK